MEKDYLTSNFYGNESFCKVKKEILKMVFESLKPYKVKK